MKSGTKLLAIALLFAGLVLLNYLAVLHSRCASMRPPSKIYTLSPGTRALLGKIEEPIQLDFYFSRSASTLPIAVKNYADRVLEMLRQYVRAAHGKIILNVIDPKPDTPEEEKATAAGIAPQTWPATGRAVLLRPRRHPGRPAEGHSPPSPPTASSSSNTTSRSCSTRRSCSTAASSAC